MIDLYFKTKSQQMVFCDPASGHIVSAWSLLPGTPYDVFLYIENAGDEEAPNVKVKITHGPVGIGFTNSANLIIPNPVSVPPVPPAEFGVNGEATVKFTYDVPVGGIHTCLLARFDPDNGRCISQNTTVLGLPSGLPGKTSFQVYGMANPSVLLTLTESTEAGIVILPNAPNSWQPMLNAMPGSGIGPETPTPSPIQLHNLDAASSYSIILGVTPAGTDAHIFNIAGTDPGGNNVGSVDIKIEVTAAPSGTFIAPAPYVLGAYHSPDIVLTDLITGYDIPLVGLNDDQLQSNTSYGYSVWVHNASPTDAENTTVRFWQKWGGVALDGKKVDEQTVSIAAYGSKLVKSDFPFISAPPGEHTCAVVSIFNAMSGCQVDATDASQIPAPSGQGDPGCSAWRNTDSLPVFAGGPYHIKLNLGIYKKVFGPGPVEINMIAKHVPVEWQKDTKAIETEKLLKSIGVERRMPLYLLPAFRETHAPIDLKPQFKMDEKSKAQGKGTGSKFLIEPVAEQDAPFTISGTVPKETKNGDIILVTVTAKYPGNKKSPAKSIEFLAALHVTNK